MIRSDVRLVFPPAPPGGGFLVVPARLFNNPEFRKACAEIYPNTEIRVQRSLTTGEPM